MKDKHFSCNLITTLIVVTTKLQTTLSSIKSKPKIIVYLAYVKLDTLIIFSNYSSTIFNYMVI
jgi:hypothetical protein